MSRGESSVSPTEKMNRDCATIYLSDVNFPELFRYIFLYYFVVICLGYLTITSWTFFYCWKTTCIKRQTDNFKILAHRGRKPQKKQWWDKRAKAWRGMESIKKDFKNPNKFEFYFLYWGSYDRAHIKAGNWSWERYSFILHFCFEVSILNSTVLTYSVLKLRSEPPRDGENVKPFENYN